MPNLLRSLSLFNRPIRKNRQFMHQSLIVLEKREVGSWALIDEQPSIFMYPCRYVGIDDPARRRWMPGDDELRDNARKEVETVIQEGN